MGAKAVQPWVVAQGTLGALLGMLVVVSSASADAVRVTALGKGLDPLESTAEIQHQDAAFVDSETPVSLGLEVPEGHLLSARAGDLFLELTCPNGSRLQFSERFAVTVQPAPEGVDCAVDLGAGQVDVITDQATQVEADELVFATTGTRYAVRSRQPNVPAGGRRQETREREAPKKVRLPLDKVLVFEGEILVRISEEEPTPLASGRTLRVVTDENRRLQLLEDEVSSKEIESWSRTYARFDVVKARATGRTSVDYDRLVRLHASVLADPDNAAARGVLATVQRGYGVEADAAYHQRRLDRESVSRLEESEEDTLARYLPLSYSGCVDLVAAVIRDEPLASHYSEVAIAIQNERDAGKPVTSRHFYQFAVASENIGSGKTVAEQALLAHAKDGLLSDREVDFSACVAHGRTGDP